MKIIDVIPHVLSTPLSEPFAFSQGWVEKRSSMIVEIVTDEGITGWGGIIVSWTSAAGNRCLICPVLLKTNAHQS